MGAAVHTLVDRRGPAGAPPGWGSLLVDETYARVAGVWSYVYRAVDQQGRVIDVYLSRRRDIGSAHVLHGCPGCSRGPGEVITDRAPALANVVEELLPAAWHHTGQFENNRVECDHGPA